MSTGPNDHHQTRRPSYQRVELVLPLEVLEILRDLGATCSEAVTRLALRHRDLQTAELGMPDRARSRPGPRVTGSGWGKGGAKVTGDAWFEGRAGSRPRPKNTSGSNTEPGRRAHAGRRKTLRDLFEQTPFRLRVIHRSNPGSWTGAVIARASGPDATVTTLILDLGEGRFKRVQITEHASGSTESRPRFYELADPTYRVATDPSSAHGQGQSMEAWKAAMREARERMAAAHPDKGGPGGEAFVRAKTRVDELKSRRPDPCAHRPGDG
jgi:hypothetical protein